MTDIYVCPYHARAGGYQASTRCGGWNRDGPDEGQLCTQASRFEADCVRRLRGVDADLVAVTNYRQELAATRRSLMLTLISRFGWSQHAIADELGISQARVHVILNGRKKKGDGDGRRRRRGAQGSPGKTGACDVAGREGSPET